jgi:hypothetical protein
LYQSKNDDLLPNCCNLLPDGPGAFPMKGPRIGEVNLGAAAGAVVGAIGGLFAIGIAPAIIGKNASLLIGTPMLALISCLISGPIGWVIGGQVGPRLAELFKSQRVEVVGGIVGGLVPVVAIALWAWYMVTPR